MSDTKICSICGITKHYLQFNINGRDGYRNKKCKICLSKHIKTKNIKLIETRICKACGIIRPLTYFWILTGEKRQSRCKICFKKKIFIYPKVNPEDRPPKKRKSEMFRLNATTFEDYELTYKFLEICGYDIKEDIHKQFCEKYNLKYKKKNVFTQPEYLYDGTLNPLRKK